MLAAVTCVIKTEINLVITVKFYILYMDESTKLGSPQRNYKVFHKCMITANIIQHTSSIQTNLLESIARLVFL